MYILLAVVSIKSAFILILITLYGCVGGCIGIMAIGKCLIEIYIHKRNEFNKYNIYIYIYIYIIYIYQVSKVLKAARRKATLSLNSEFET